ncbi:hypothetical protein LTR35_000305 [Friedmanniomyces endolithicus]|nr:hypothetical protein LTS00_011143 [Friedmanniomyces endolithicus]KAK0293699.1 hypothetical protein LTR35_000305 [Friedmanniomyces endolithicus]KAK0993005.1 hypothetical protein LTR54_011327 [Friedmanniomyces endolithicus]
MGGPIRAAYKAKSRSSPSTLLCIVTELSTAPTTSSFTGLCKISYNQTRPVRLVRLFVQDGRKYSQLYPTMAFNEYNSMEGYIDPRQLEWAIEGSHEQAGSWAEQQFNNAAMEAQDPVAASLAMEDFPGYQDLLQPQIGWLDAAYSSATRQLLPNDASTLSAPQPTNFNGSMLQPRAEAFLPESVRRPQLQLQTMDIGLQPGMPAYDQPLPRSAPAPDIRIYEPDSLPVHVPMTSLPIYESSRRRAHSNPHSQPPSLYHAATAPETPITPTSGFLRPALASWMETDHALPKACIAQSSFEASPIRSPIRNRRGSASPSRSRSNSRHGLQAASNKSSVSGGYECHHVGCGKQYSTIAKLNHHRRYHTPDHERPNVCDQCGARFLFKRELDRHKLSITHGDRQFFCTRCNAGFGRPDHLSRHIKQDSCLDRALTPSPTSLPYSTPSTAASSVPRKLRHRVSTGDMRSGTPATDFNSLLHYDDTAFIALSTQGHALTDVDCDPFLDTTLQQWDPSSPLATRPRCSAQQEIEEAWSKFVSDHRRF